MEQLELSLQPERRAFTVSELSARIRGLFDSEFRDVWVSGEISGVKASAAGHCYFTLKDETAQLQCVCFRQALRFVKCKPQDGLSVLARGRIDVYETRGQYQLIAEALEPLGLGALQLAFEQLKKKLAAEGLFDPARKRPLPAFPLRIGIVTSPTGAVIQDMIHIFSRRFPGLHIRLYPALVQGEGSAESVCRGIAYFSAHPWADVLIVARGGGSLEDLWTFNEETVARAIRASSVPVISAIGHETDFTIADFTADLRAPTPSAAAELAVRTREQVIGQFSNGEQRLAQSMRYKLATAGRRLLGQGIGRAVSELRRALGRLDQRTDELDYRLRDRIRIALASRRAHTVALSARLATQDLRLRFAAARRRLDSARASSLERIRMRLALGRGALGPLAAHLSQLSPLKILDRGYAIVRTEAGALVKHPGGAPPGSRIGVRVSGGSLAARVLKA